MFVHRVRYDRVRNDRGLEMIGSHIKRVIFIHAQKSTHCLKLHVYSYNEKVVTYII